MKKVLLTLLMIIFTSLSANATYTVHFGNTGHPAYAVHGGTVRRSLHSFGSNAAFTPSNRIRPARVSRTKAMTRAMKNMNRYGGNGYGNAYSYRAANVVSVEPSRFSRNYTPRTQRSYTRSGITYYN